VYLQWPQKPISFKVKFEQSALDLSGMGFKNGSPSPTEICVCGNETNEKELLTSYSQLTFLLGEVFVVLFFFFSQWYHSEEIQLYY
jgi:hypothetical protein